jgi:uncharacterized membrane protein YdjX (TVP38/TMEM64 family)
MSICGGAGLAESGSDSRADPRSFVSSIRARTWLALGVLAALVLVAILLPIPGPAQLRAWADTTGPATVVLVFLAYAVLTVAPLPRTAFTLATGLFLGTVTGTVVALAATSVSALLAFGLARSVGRGLVARHLDRTAVRAVDARLSGGGWLAVASLRLIPVVPFAPMNYCCGISSVRVRPYLAGSFVGSLPGTLAAVVLADSLTGTGSPAMLAVSGGCAVLGAVGLLVTIRHGTAARAPGAEPEIEPAEV